MALAHHDAAQRDQRRGGETELLGAEQAGDRDITPGLELAVGLQHHPRAQIVGHQRLMRLGNAQLPRQARMLDGSERRSPGAAGIPGNHQVVRTRLGNARGNRPHANLGAELDADARFRVAALQIMDELGDILDRIDIVGAAAD